MTIRAALLLGFGLTAGIWGFAGYYYNQRVGQLETRTANISARYLKAQDLLSLARNQVIRASVLIRDALLDTNQPPLRDYPRELAVSYSTAEQALQQYVPVLDAASERDRVLTLEREIARLRNEMQSVLGEVRRGPGDAGRVLSDRIMPRREAVIRIAEELQSLNREAFVQHQNEIAEVHHVTQRIVWQFLGVALAASVCIGVLAMAYAGRLEQRIRRQSDQDAVNRRDLQRLSASLVTAQEEERRAIARELHDEVGQVLTAIKVELAVAARTAGPNNQALADARAITERAMHTVRDLSQLLHPPLLDDLGLPETLEWYVKDFRKRHGLLVDLAIDQPVGELSREATVAAYRIVQEALHNVVKHARAAHCRVSLTQAPHALRLVIEDDGVGFEVAQLNGAGGARGLGLIGIRERAAQLRGRVQIDSVPGGGTRVEIELPQPGRGEPLAAPPAGDATVVAPSPT
jgi:signal transduction histidine kinase